jgi:hypothetical protein
MHLLFILFLCTGVISAGSLSIQIHNDGCVIQAVDVSGCSGISDIIAHPKGSDCSGICPRLDWKKASQELTYVL